MPPKKIPPKKTTGVAKKPAAAAAKKPAAADAKKPAPADAKKDAVPAEAPAAPVAAPEPAGPTVRDIEFKEVNKVILKDDDGQIKASNKWPLVMDPSDRVSAVLRHQYGAYINVLQQADMQPERLRMCLLGAMRFGSKIVLDLMEGDLYGSATEFFDTVKEGLLKQLLDKSILKEENYMQLLKDTDTGDYARQAYFVMEERFEFALITQNAHPNPELMKLTYPVRVAAP